MKSVGVQSKRASAGEGNRNRSEGKGKKAAGGLTFRQ